MTIVRREHRAHFTILPNAIFLDQRLSIEAKGVLGYLLSRPNKWSVRLEQVGRTLHVGRRKLQRIFRELIRAGYVTREQRRVAGAQRFGQVDYVVRDVPVTIGRPVDNSVEPRVQKGPAAQLPQVRGTPQESELWPRVRNGPAYKELKNKETLEPMTAARVEKPHGMPARSSRPPVPPDEDTRHDTAIVALFRDPADGWGFLTSLTADDLADVRARYRRGELNRFTIIKFWNRIAWPDGDRGGSRS